MITYTDHNGKTAVMSTDECLSIEASGSAMYFVQRDREPVAQAIELIRAMDKRPGKIAPGERPPKGGIPMKEGLLLHPPDPAWRDIKKPVLYHWQLKDVGPRCGAQSWRNHQFSTPKFDAITGTIRACPKCEAMFLESMSKDRLDRHHRKQRRRAVVMAATMARKAEREREAIKKMDQSPTFEPMNWTKDELKERAKINTGSVAGTAYRKGGPDKSHGSGKIYMR